MIDTQTPLTDREADKLKTELYRRNICAKLRELRMFSPSDIGGFVGLPADEIARLAGRKYEKTVPEA